MQMKDIFTIAESSAVLDVMKSNLSMLPKGSFMLFPKKSPTPTPGLRKSQV